MARRKIQGQVYYPYLLAGAAALFVVGWLVSRAVRDFHEESISQHLEEEARIVGRELRDDFAAGDLGRVAARIDELHGVTTARITVILPSGAVLAETDEALARMPAHTPSSRPEIAAALAGRVGRATRFSETLRRRMFYVAVPLVLSEDGRERVAAVVRTALPGSRVDAALGAIHLRIVITFVGLALLLAAIGWLVSRRITRPLEQLRAGARAFAEGNLSSPLPVAGIEEIGDLAEALNRMAAQLDARIRTITEQRNELGAILAGMVEGVLAVDGEGRIVSLNPAGARMLKLDAGRARGRPVQEAVRNTALQDLVAAALARQGPVEGEITLHEGEARNVQVRGVPLGDPGGSRTGALLVLDDVTHLRRLERVRQDFVANVTHELRTPITSIQAAAETLTEGECAEEEAERFLAIIARQTRRLNAIIDDLLQLSRIEAEADGGRISLEEHPLDLVLTGAVQACAARAAERQISIELHCDPSLRARIDAALIENAVVNLIDNAIKYSDERTRVRVSASEGGDAVVIEVVDRGWGIDPRHHDRIFERFYVVDRGRSRSVGGTGLGLAIVRHIVLAHGGRVELESAPGEGSTFRLVLPRN